MNARIKLLLVAVSICLQGADAVLAVIGHRHDDADHTHCQSRPDVASVAHVHSHGGCKHHHRAHAPEKLPESSSEHSQPNHSQDNHSHDDCSLCRHFSQAVTIAVLVKAPSDSVRVEPLAALELPAATVRRTARARSRGPPGLLI